MSDSQLTPRIPKIIHQIWIGQKYRRPELWMQTWGDMNPEWEYRLWTDDNIPELRCQAAYDAMPHLSGKADILRYDLLHRFGGVYVDADSECVSPLTDDLCDNLAFAVHENEYIRPGLTANGVIGTQPGCPLMTAMSDHIETLQDLAGCASTDVWKVTGPLLLTRTIGRGLFSFVRIYPSYWFYPEHCSGLKYAGVVDRCYAKQYWGGTKTGIYEPT